MNLKKMLNIFQILISIILLVFIGLQFFGKISYADTKHIFYTLLIINLIIISANVAVNKEKQFKLSNKSTLSLVGLTALLTIAVLAFLLINI